METKQCKNCQKDFTIDAEDFSFYEKIKVPTPTWCPDCRQQRRYAWRNERTLYWRNCDLCGKNMVTIYYPNKPYKVHCLTCWWGDGWDTSIYGRNFDFSRPFFEQFAELQREVPRMALLSKNNVNSEYANHCANDKNVFLTFCSFYSEDILYSTWVMNSRNCMDTSYTNEGGEKLYECIDSNKSYQCQFSAFLEGCVNCYYCYDCRNCNDCFLSSNLRNKSYVFKNQQYSREEYLQKIKEYNLSSHKVRQKLNDEFMDLLKNNFIHRYVMGERNVNSIGSTLFNSKNSKSCFDSEKLEDTKYIISSMDIKSAMDLYHIGFGTELAYENHGCVGLYNSHFCHLCYDNRDIQYADSCQNCQDLFGCISVKKGQYMIFNKKYSKEEYHALREKIIEYMKHTGEYGEYFPPSIAPICYNESQGNYYMPETRENILARGWLWEDKVPGTFGKETMAPEALPDLIEEANDEILSAILRCDICTKNYNIVPNELNFYHREKIPLPRNCPECRHKRRFALRLPRKLWQRKCSCDKKHPHHAGPCQIEFETPYESGRPEKVYCEKCYLAEVY
jgi:hypothetical protein